MLLPPPGRSRMSRRLLPPAVAVTALLACAPLARAGTYDVYSCWAGSDSFRNPGANGSAWVKTSDPNGQYSAFDQCGGSDNGMGVISVGGYEAPGGRSGEVSFTAPSGMRVVGVRLWRMAWSSGSGSGGDSKRNFLRLLADGAHAAQGGAADGSAAVPVGAAGTPDVSNHGLIPGNEMDADLSGATPATVSYRVGWGCASCPTGDSNGGFAAGVKFYGSFFTVRNTT